MIAVYPSRHPINIYPSQDGQALERHTPLEGETLHEWLTRIVTAYDPDALAPLTIDVNGKTITQEDWSTTRVKLEDDVRIYPTPRGIEVGFIGAAVIGAVVGAVVLLYANSLNVDPGAAGSISGNTLDINPAKANTVRIYEPIREILGRARVYPDYLCQPVTRFAGPRDVRTSMFLCIGKGRHAVQPGSVKIGGTPVSAFGSDVSYTIYNPGDNVGSDPRSENWYLCPEVGASKSATAGLDLESPVSTSSIVAEGLALSGKTVTLLGANFSIPESWGAGTLVTLETPNSYTVTESGGRSMVSGDLSELAPFVGMLVTISTPAADIDATVAVVNPYIPPTPGTGGAPSMVTASAAPLTYDFTVSPVSWNLTYQGVTRSVSLSANYLNMSGLLYEISSQLSGTGLTAVDNSGRVRITEPSSPYRGGAIAQTGAPVSVFGSAPVYVTGSASSGGSPGQTASVGFNLTDGTPANGFGSGTQRMTIGYRGLQYRVASITDGTITVDRLNASGNVDASWGGFSNRSVIDYLMQARASSGENWLGPFFMCPEGETVDRIEWDVFYPGGLQSTTKKGGETPMESRIEVQYADVLTGAWVTISRSYVANTRDGIGYTQGVDLATPMRPMMRMRRRSVSGYQVVSDRAQWFAARGRLLERKTVYEGVTTLALTVRTGERLSAQSDRKINLVATRLYDNGNPRSISAAIRYVCESVGAVPEDIDLDQLEMLEQTYWTPRNETYDDSFDKSESLIKVIRRILTAGMSHPTVIDGQISAVREGVQPAQGAITPHDETSELKISFTAPNVDDFGGVDVKYIDPVTFEPETARCRLPGVNAQRVEEYELTGVQSERRAWVIGMRRLMKHQTQRLAASCSTEMAALAYEYLTHVIFTADIPGDGTQSMVIERAELQGDRWVIEVSEKLDESFDSPRVFIRRQDGSLSTLLTPVITGRKSMTLPLSAIDWSFDPTIEPPRLIYCSSESVGYPMMINSIQPDSDGLCQVTGEEYSDNLYRWDDSMPDANGYPSEI